jgi:hypothetical protein
MNPPPRRPSQALSPSNGLCGLLTAAVFLLVGGLLFLSAMDRDLNHDEHQFIAPGVLISREGLLPYRDFPMFHLPNLAFIYAGLDRLTHQPVWSAKVLNALASTAAVALIFLAGTTRRSPVPFGARHYGYALAAGALLLTDQLFTFTAGKTWNHEFPGFLLVAAILAHVRGVETGRWSWAAVSGFCVGAAIGTRLTYAPVAMAFPGLLLLAPLPRRDRLIALAAWSGACLVALTPSIYFLCADHERFLFDNLQFPRLRLLDLADTRAHKTMNPLRKLRFLFKEVLAHSLPLTLAFIAASIEPVRRWLKRQNAENYGFTVCAGVLPLAVLGCFLPSRYQYQHYFVVAPLMALGMAYALRGWQPARWYGPAAILGAVMFGLSPLNFNSQKRSGGIPAYKPVPAMLDSGKWFTTRLRADYEFVRVAKGSILTLAPIGVLEAGGRIYPEFATGPFAWRTAHLLAAEKRGRAGLIAPEDLEQFLRTRPPGGILTGVEDEELEKDFITYAQAHAFHAVPSGKRRTLWLPD